jgi:hypothetical protein
LITPTQVLLEEMVVAFQGYDDNDYENHIWDLTFVNFLKWMLFMIRVHVN